MKKLTKRSILAVLALVLAVVTLGTTSYAWFTIGNTVIVSDIELNVQGGEGLEVSYVGKDGEEGYVSVLTTTDLLNFLAADYGVDKADSDATAGDTFKNSFEWDTVTSTDGKEFKTLETRDSNGALLENPTLSDVVSNQNVNSGLIEFKLRFRTLATGNVSLIWNHLTLESKGVDWSPEVAFPGIGQEVTNGMKYFAHNGARVSITDTNPGTEPAATVYEKANAPSTNGNYGNVATTEGAINWDNGAHPYFKLVTGTNLENAFTDLPTIAETTVVDPGTTPITVAGFVAGEPGDNHMYADITIRIYLEGFDSETFNAILSDNLRVALRFTFKEQE